MSGAARAVVLPLLLAALPAQPAPADATARPLRLGVVQWLRQHREEEEKIVPPVYSNHLPKSLVHETLVVVDRTGRVGPGLAERWESDPDGRRHVFHLRPGATFHDGSPCDAEAVRRCFASWLVREQDRFIGLCERIERIEVLGPRALAFHLREGYAPLADLALMNPMGIAAGDRMVGTGPWRVVDFEPMRRARYARHEAFDGPRPRLPEFEWVTLIAGADRDPVSTWALERGHVDAVIESWRPSIPRDLAAELVAQGKARLVRGPGSMVQLLCFNHERAPFAEVGWRLAVRAAVDRAALIRAGEHGFARPCTTLFDPDLADWPEAAAPASTCSPPGASAVAAELILPSTDPAQAWLAIELQRQLRPAGIDVAVTVVTPKEHARRAKAGDYDLLFARTWGAPYDPPATLYSRFRPQTPQARAGFFAEPELTRLIEASMRLGQGPPRAALYARIQALLDEHAALVPLYVPDRIALLGPDVDGIALGDSVYAIDLRELRTK